MTPTELDDWLDVTAKEAGADPNLMPGLITINTDAWVKDLADLRAPCSALHDGMRYREVQVHVSSAFETAVLTRTEAGARGEPYRDLTARG